MTAPQPFFHSDASGFRIFPVLLFLLVALFFGGKLQAGESAFSHQMPVEEIDAVVRQLVESRELTGDPATPRGLSPVVPDEDPLVKLGQLLFFSHSLSGGGDSTCGTCHHPDFGGSDGLSLPVGVVPEDRNVVGPGREVHHDRDRDPLADGGPNMHRNSQSIFNVALFDRALMHDGRVFVAGDEPRVHGGFGQRIVTPDTANVSEVRDDFGLLEAVVPFPLVNPNEMRGFLFPEIALDGAYRQRLMHRLQGRVDEKFTKPAAAENWLERFRDAFNSPEETASQLITIPNMQRSIAAYMRSMTFVDTPWRQYLKVLSEDDSGRVDVISESAKKGAFLFYANRDKGGLGCASCHAGDRLTNEAFFNTAFPQIGRGFRRADREDRGRWGVTKNVDEWYAMRVPSLLNVAVRGPWGHAGTFSSLEGLIRYHADPETGVEEFDWTLEHLDQFKGDGKELYPKAKVLTGKAVAHPTFQETKKRLPGSLDDAQIRQLVAFLETLTDSCVAEQDCIRQWAPERDEDPDGHLLVRGDDSIGRSPAAGVEPPQLYPDGFELGIPDDQLQPRETFPELSDHCGLNEEAGNREQAAFLKRTEEVLPGDPHGFALETWRVGHGDLTDLEQVMLAGGVSAAYLDDDCWPDLVFAGGDASGIVPYRNLGNQNGFERKRDWLAENPGTMFTGAAVADLTGNYRRELLLGNLKSTDLPVFYLHDDGRYHHATSLWMSRSSYGISFGFPEPEGEIGFYLGHWGRAGLTGTAPAMWQVYAGRYLLPRDQQMGTSNAHLDHSWNLTPLFADMTENGFQDLLITSDFGTTSVMMNQQWPLSDEPRRYFEDYTDRRVITDENGMGAALADFGNRGRLDWFVSAVYEPAKKGIGNWGVTGNRMYRNTSDERSLSFTDVTTESGLREGDWGWGSCAADFNNNGFVDIFHVDGWGYIPESLYEGVEDDRGMRAVKEAYDELTRDRFQGLSPQLFINNGDGTFTDRTAEWGLDVPSEGRGIACFDYDRDGDIDIVLLDHSSGLQFFENQIGNGPGARFINIRLVGERPNTDALGARVYVMADIGGAHGMQTQMRVSQANSNFNGQNLPDLHFGLGDAQEIDKLRVVWPDGSELRCSDGLTINEFLVIDQRDDNGNGACP